MKKPHSSQILTRSWTIWARWSGEPEVRRDISTMGIANSGSFGSASSLGLMLKAYAEGTELRAADSASDLMLVTFEVSKAWATAAIWSSWEWVLQKRVAWELEDLKGRALCLRLWGVRYDGKKWFQFIGHSAMEFFTRCQYSNNSMEILIIIKN